MTINHTAVTAAILGFLTGALLPGAIAHPQEECSCPECECPPCPDPVKISESEEVQRALEAIEAYEEKAVQMKQKAIEKLTDPRYEE